MKIAHRVLIELLDGPATTIEIAERTGFTARQIRSAMAELANHLEVRGTTQRPPILYALTAKGRERARRLYRTASMGIVPAAVATVPNSVFALGGM